MRRLLPISLVLTLSVASAQMRLDQMTKVKDSDPAVQALKEWQQRIEANYRQGGAVAEFSSWFVLSSESLNTLFPQYRFFAVSCSGRPARGKERKPKNLAKDLRTTLVCDAAGKIIKELRHTGNFEGFGELLSSAQVAIRTTDDAKLVWSAFCEVYLTERLLKLPAIKIDHKTWHLGVSADSLTYFKVLLDDNSRILGFTFISMRSKGRSMPRNPGLASEKALSGYHPPRCY